MRKKKKEETKEEGNVRRPGGEKSGEGRLSENLGRRGDGSRQEVEVNIRKIGGTRRRKKRIRRTSVT